MILVRTSSFCHFCEHDSNAADKAEVKPQQKEGKGAFVRGESQHRNWIRADGSSPYQPEKGRYHLYIANNCPWCHRSLAVLSKCLPTPVKALSRAYTTHPHSPLPVKHPTLTPTPAPTLPYSCSKPKFLKPVQLEQGYLQVHGDAWMGKSSPPSPASRGNTYTGA